jgi:hypothetical protein
MTKKQKMNDPRMTPSQMTAFLAVLGARDDRSAVIVAVSLIHELLAQTLTKALVDPGTGDNTFLSRFVDSFNNCIELALK